MRRLSILPAVLILSGIISGPAMAQTPPPVAAPVNGVTIAETQAWLTGLGGAVQAPTVVDGVTSLHIADQPLPWNLTFYACGPSLCDDVQFSAVFSGAITPDQINTWNTGHRYLKAFFVPAPAGGQASAVVQYDVVLTSTGTDQLHEPTVIWVQSLRTFAQGLARTPAPAVP